MVEQRSPKPRAVSSSLTAPAKEKDVLSGVFFFGKTIFKIFAAALKESRGFTKGISFAARRKTDSAASLKMPSGTLMSLITVQSGLRLKAGKVFPPQPVNLLRSAKRETKAYYEKSGTGASEIMPVMSLYEHRL